MCFSEQFLIILGAQLLDWPPRKQGAAAVLGVLEKQVRVPVFPAPPLLGLLHLVIVVTTSWRDRYQNLFIFPSLFYIGRVGEGVLLDPGGLLEHLLGAAAEQ